MTIEFYGSSTKREVINLAEQIAIWKRARMSFYADDILNMLIDMELISHSEVITIVEYVNNREETTPKLPNNHLVQK